MSKNMSDQNKRNQASNKDDQIRDDMQNIMRALPEIQIRETKVLIHSQIINKIYHDNFSNQNASVLTQIAVQQNIMTGYFFGPQKKLNFNDPKKFQKSELKSKMIDVSKYLSNDKDKVRMIAIFLENYSS